MHSVILKPGKANPFWHHEPLVFSGAIARVDGPVQVADLVQVLDHQGKYVGIGFFNPHSQYRVRIALFHDEPRHTTLQDILQLRIHQALTQRQQQQLPSATTNAFRLINSEGDGLSGLTIDVFADHVVIAATAYWVMEHRHQLEAALKFALPHHHLHWLPSYKALAQDGWVAEKESLNPNYVTISEHGLRYLVDVQGGQKTGFYCDQRDNRLLIRNSAPRRRVLDCYCYTGGFALNAAYAGAEYVLGIDSSAHAIETAKQNATLNQLNNIEFKQAKAELFLAEAKGFDIIILDPPKLAPSKKHLDRAKRAYLKLNRLALAALPAQGQLITCSCSDAMHTDLFILTIKRAAKQAGRKIAITHVSGAGPDHPSHEHAQYGAYLKVVWVTVLE